MLVPRFLSKLDHFNFLQFIQLEKLYILFVQLRYSHWLFQGRRCFVSNRRGLPSTGETIHSHFDEARKIFSQKEMVWSRKSLKSDLKYRSEVPICEKFVRFNWSLLGLWFMVGLLALNAHEGKFLSVLVAFGRNSASNLTRNLKIDGHPHPS